MKIAFLIYGGLDLTSGGFLYDRQVAGYLRQKGDRVDVISLGWPGYGSALAGRGWNEMADGLLGSDFDIILQDELAHPSLCLLNSRWKALRSKRLVSVVHHLRCCEQWPRWQKHLYKQIEKIYLNSVDGFIFNSCTTRDAVRSLCSRGKMQGVVAYPSASHVESTITVQDIVDRARRHGPFEILFIGNIIRRKQLHLLVRALTNVTGEWRLTVVGSGETDRGYVTEIRRVIDAAGLGPRIAFLGPVSSKELSHVAAQSNTLVVPSAYEGFGISYLEGMASGLPPVATDAGGAKEIISDGCDGFIVPAGDARAIAGRLQYMMDNRTVLAEMGVNALDTYRGWPSWDDCGSKVHDFLHGPKDWIDT